MVEIGMSLRGGRCCIVLERDAVEVADGSLSAATHPSLYTFSCCAL